MNDLAHYIQGPGAVNIAAGIEEAVRAGRLASGAKLPPVRALAANLGVSPATVAAAYRALRLRGLLIAHGRRGTRVSHRPIWQPHHPPPLLVADQARNLYDGNPDPALLPDMGPALAAIDPSPRLYGQPPLHPELVQWTAAELRKEGVAPGQVTLANGALDAIERVLSETLRPGDRVAVEDPGFGNIHNLVISHGLSLAPVSIDDEGMLPDALWQACEDGAKALIVTPRAQNPTGAALSSARAVALRTVLRRYPGVLVIEDDHAALITDAPLQCLHTGRARWAYIRSFAKALNPDLRLAIITGDDQTVLRVQDRMIVGERWVSHVLQRLAWALLSDAGVRRHLQAAARTYSRRRRGLLEALESAGFSGHGASGYNVWLPVLEETPTVQALLQAGWSVAAGERFRIAAPPAIRITAATLTPAESRRLAADLATAIRRPLRTSPA